MKYFLFFLILAIIYRILKHRAQMRFDAMRKAEEQRRNQLAQQQFQQETDALNPHLNQHKTKNFTSHRNSKCIFFLY